MVMLTRTPGQRVMIKDDAGLVIATVMVSRVRGDQVRLGFEAEPEVHFVREEILGHRPPVSGGN